jgi:outer membrane protein TolC
VEADDSVFIQTDMRVTPISVDAERAVELGLTLRPQLRILDIERQKGEIDLEQTRGNGSFRMDVELTYGREMEDEALRGLLEQPSNSYTLGVRGTLPIWDWGARRARIDAQQAVLSRTQLSIQETREQIQVEIRNMVRNLDEYHQRALSMERNLTLAREVSAQTLQQYREGRITILDLLQSFERQEDTARNFLQAFLGYRGAILDLQRMTYYDFENQVPVLERFGIQAGS